MDLVGIYADHKGSKEHRLGNTGLDKCVTIRYSFVDTLGSIPMLWDQSLYGLFHFHFT